MKKTLLAALIAGVIAAGFSIYPQMRLRELRGEAYNGVFATYDLDETAYAAYLQALIDGRPRKNDPYTGRDDQSASPQPESIFSIQFITALAVAWPARVLGLTAVEAMPLISIISAFLTALALFWLIHLFTGNAWFSLAGTLTVIAGGALISGIGVFSTFYEGGQAYPYLPLLRRHIPSLSFPFLFAFFGCLYKAFDSEQRRRRIMFALAAAGCFGVLLFSYFYLWTSVLAILGVMVLIGLVQRREGIKRDLGVALPACGAIGLLLIPYAYLLSHRNQTADAAQLLVITHAPDLLRNVEIIGAATAGLALLVWLLWAEWLGRLRMTFICAFGLGAAVVFNQQVLTGRSLQPFHYEYYSMNYVVLLAFVLLATLALQRLLAGHSGPQVAAATAVTLIAVGWGTFEVFETTKLWDDINIVRDEAMPVNRRLAQLADRSEEDPRNLATLNLDSLQGDSQPTTAKFPVLWARHQHSFAGIVSSDESKLRYYKLIYFSGHDSAWLRKALEGCADIEACMTLFGWDRFNATLSANARGLTTGEVDEEIRNYARFEQEFDGLSAYEPKLKYLVLRTGDAVNPRIAEWYEVGPAEVFGGFALSELTPRFK